MPTPYCAALGSHDGEYGDGLVSRVRLRRDRSVRIPKSCTHECLARR
jgi:hypothetical protein